MMHPTIIILLFASFASASDPTMPLPMCQWNNSKCIPSGYSTLLINNTMPASQVALQQYALAASLYCTKLSTSTSCPKPCQLQGAVIGSSPRCVFPASRVSQTSTCVNSTAYRYYDLVAECSNASSAITCLTVPGCAMNNMLNICQPTSFLSTAALAAGCSALVGCCPVSEASFEINALCPSLSTSDACAAYSASCAWSSMSLTCVPISQAVDATMCGALTTSSACAIPAVQVPVSAIQRIAVGATPPVAYAATRAVMCTAARLAREATPNVSATCAAFVRPGILLGRP